MNFALIKDGIVINTVACESEKLADELFSSEYTVVNIDNKLVGVGWFYHEGVFTNPDTPPPPDESFLYELELDAINTKFESDKGVLAAAYLNAILFDGVNEQQKRDEIYQKLRQLNAAYDQQVADLEVKYGG